MSSTKKGNQWYFGMKAHIGADAGSGLVHSLIFTPAKVPDNKVMDQLLHGEEESVHGDKAYTSKRHKLLASDPKQGPIWCMPFKKPAGGERGAGASGMEAGDQPSLVQPAGRR